MEAVNVAKRKRELEHGRLRGVVEALELAVNQLLEQPDDTVFTDVGTALEDPSAAAGKVLAAQDAYVDAVTVSFAAENPEATEEETTAAIRAADEFTLRLKAETRRIRGAAYRALDAVKKSKPQYVSPIMGPAANLPGGAAWAGQDQQEGRVPSAAASTTTTTIVGNVDLTGDPLGGGDQVQDSGLTTADKEESQAQPGAGDGAARSGLPPPHTAAGGGGGGGGDPGDQGGGDRSSRRPPRGRIPAPSPSPSEDEGDKHLKLFQRMVEGLEARVETARAEKDSYAAALSRALADERKSVVELQNKTVQALRQPQLECGVYQGRDDQDFVAWRTAFLQLYPDTMEPSERFLGLRAKTGGAAKELLVSLQVADSSYEEAMKRLDAKYGTPAQIMARMDRNFKSVPAVKQATDSKGLRSIFERIRTMVFTYRQLGEPMSGSYLIGTWLEKLPVRVRTEWVKATLDDDLVVDDVLDEDSNVILKGNGMTKKTGNVDAFLAVLNRSVRMAEGLDDICPGEKRGEKEKKDNVKPGKKGGASNSALLAAGHDSGAAKPAAGKGAAGGGGGGAKKKAAPAKKEYTGKICEDCKNNKTGHLMQDCAWFKKLDVPSRKQVVWDLLRCKKCLEKGHTAKNCTSTEVCKAAGCRNPTKHHPMLHKD